MRQLFSSPRQENVERLEALLQEQGIATRVTNRGTWDRATARDFSYTQRSGGKTWPALWVVNADDYGRARDILRDCGLLESTRPGVSTYLPAPAPAAPASPEQRANKVRLALFGIALVLAILTALRLAGLM